MAQPAFGQSSWAGPIQSARSRIYKTFSWFVDDTGEEKVYFCTSFLINARERYLATASHCVANFPGGIGEITVGNKFVQVAVVADFPDLDLAVLRAVAPIGKKALRLARQKAVVGQVVAGIGWGLGRESLIASFGWVSNYGPRLRTSLARAPAPGILIYGNFLGGMSGGPLLNESGDVVGMVICGGSHGTDAGLLGCSATTEQLKTLPWGK